MFYYEMNIRAWASILAAIHLTHMERLYLYNKVITRSVNG
ncbi:MAG: hypothetical protein Ct9H300mP4_13310 [Gammaproteobacteria bacterium]|nr:MAG: hypothetical protein Ct9H300mP4_13310 [Gammaproteobacteria bacterium]